MSALKDVGRKPRKPRVRRDPIDLEQIAAEFAAQPRRSEQELVAALEAEVQRANEARTASAAIAVDVHDPVDLPTPAPAPAPLAPSETVVRSSEPGIARESGLPLDQVRAWLEQVKEDLRKVQARLQYLEFEHARLQDQHHLCAELISSSKPV